MNQQPIPDNAYAICLDNIKHKQFCYRTVSLFDAEFGERGRDFRKPYPVNVANFETIMGRLNQHVHWIRNEADLTKWSNFYGWALISVEFAERSLSAFLERRECVKSAIGLFWDVWFSRGRAKSHRVPPETQRQVLSRDGNLCIRCKKRESDGIKLTMHHVIPFSKGGETTTENLITLCGTCNQDFGNVHHPHLFALADLHHGWDPELLNSAVASNSEVIEFAITLSQNIMVSRCRIDELPFRESWTDSV